MNLRARIDLAVALAAVVASAGLGLAMASALMVSDELSSGQLQAPAGFIADGSAYHLLSPQPFLPGCKRHLRTISSSSTGSTPLSLARMTCPSVVTQ